MSKAAQLEALPDAALVPISIVREALEEERSERVRLAMVRDDTIHVWRAAATRYFLQGVPLLPPTEDDTWQQEIEGRGHIRLVSEE